jgi:hypothetical protein
MIQRVLAISAILRASTLVQGNVQLSINYDGRDPTYRHKALMVIDAGECWRTQFFPVYDPGSLPLRS